MQQQFGWYSEIENIIALSIFPNPNDITFRLTLGQSTGNELQVEVYDFIGKRNVNVNANKDSGTSYDLVLKNAAPGVYFVRVLDGARSSNTRFIIQ
ncbi:MAG: T9SS type A sorting domain-containing protein [Chitinophagales bacterium]